MRIFLLGLMVFMFSCKGGPSDEQLQKDVTSALSASPGVMASVSDGVVTLTGTCPDDPCKTSSETTAKGVKGVKSVVNSIVVNTPPPPSVEVSPDAPLQDSLSSLLSAYKGVEAKVNDGVVTLTGEVKRSQLRTLMQRVNALKPKKVENKLVIK